MKTISKIVIAATSCVALSIAMLGNAQKAQAAALINGNFEQPVVSNNLQWTNYDESDVVGWETTASDNRIEIQTCRLFHCGANGTQQYAELNANEVSTLFQDVATTAGNTMYWEFFHRGRAGMDTLRLSLIDLDNNTTLFTQLYSTDNTAWVKYQGSTVATSGNTRWQFESVSAAGGNQTVGNFLDEVYFSDVTQPGSQSVPEPASIVGLLAMGAFGVVSGRKRK